MPPLMSCSVQFSVAVFFQNTSEINSLLCLAEAARVPREVSSYCCWNQEAVVHGQFGVACVSQTMNKSSVIVRNMSANT